MTRGPIWIVCLLALAAALAAPEGACARTARGVVFEDLNGNGTRDADEPGIPNVRVSNGVDITTTDDEGRYRIKADDDTIIFVIKPRAWATPIDENMLPRFYYVHSPDGAPEMDFAGVEPTGELPESVDFPLYRQREPDEFHIVLFGDTQPRDQTEIDYLAHDVVEGLVGTDASFGVTLGDILFDDLSLFDSLNSTVGLIGIPWYNVLGNHDLNFDAEDDETSTTTFESAYGPPYYSFDYGHVHFIVLDDVVWNGRVDDPNAYYGGNYIGGLGEDQLEFIRRDLEMIDEKKMVVFFMHIPLIADWVEEDREELFRLMEQRPHCLSVSAHYHTHSHVFLTEEHGWKGEKPHHHIINVTTSGSWWSGAPDEEGIPHTTMRDGAPNGHSILLFEGVAYLLDFIPARRPANEQMHIWAPEAVAQQDLASTEFVANIYNGSERSEVGFRIVGATDWAPMEKVVRPDPFYVEMKELEDGETPPAGRPMPGATDSYHIWQALLPADLAPGQHLLEVREVDMWGIPKTGLRSIRVE